MMDFGTWRKVMSIDLDGVFLGTQKGVQVMRDQDERGAIINMSSVMAYVGQDTTHETPILINALPHLPEGFKEAELGRHPVGRFGDPAGLGATVSFLMHSLTAYIGTEKQPAVENRGCFLCAFVTA